MKHCVLLSENTICFVWDQWGDLKSETARDDGLMSHHRNHMKPSVGKHITAQRQLRFNSEFSPENRFVGVGLRAVTHEFYDTLMPWFNTNWSKTTTDVNSSLSGSNDGVSGMLFLSPNGVFQPWGRGERLLFSAYTVTIFAPRETDDADDCSWSEFKTLYESWTAEQRKAFWLLLSYHHEHLPA